MSGSGCSTPSPTIPTWNTPWSTPQSSRSTATDRAQGGPKARRSILALTDALGNLVRFVLLPGQRFDTVGMPPLIEGVEFEALIADKAFDADWIIKELHQRGAKIVVSQRPNRSRPLEIDAEVY